MGKHKKSYEKLTFFQNCRILPALAAVFELFSSCFPADVGFSARAMSTGALRALSGMESRLPDGARSGIPGTLLSIRFTRRPLTGVGAIRGAARERWFR